MHKIFVLMGKSSTGKDTIYRRLLSEGSLPLKRVIPYTTRPMREGEGEGVQYHFRTEEEYKALLKSGKIIEVREYPSYYGPWYYFTADDGQIDLEKSSYLVIGTLESCQSFQKYFGRESVVPLYIEVEDGERLERALKREREDAHPRYEEMCRRFLADQKDFSEEKLVQAGIKTRFANRDLDECTRRIQETIRSELNG